MRRYRHSIATFDTTIDNHEWLSENESDAYSVSAGMFSSTVYLHQRKRHFEIQQQIKLYYFGLFNIDFSTCD